MKLKPPYPRPPIQESVIHLTFSGTATQDELTKLAGSLTNTYPLQDLLTNAIVSVDTTGGNVKFEQRLSGHRLRNTEGTSIVLLMQNSFAVSKLPPYPGWEGLRDEAKAVWSDWRRRVSATTPSRIGVRYINRIDVPIDSGTAIEVDDYLNFSPRIPNFSERPMNGMFIQVTVPTRSEHWYASVGSTILSPPPLIGNVSLVLDVDVFRTAEIPGREAELWACVDSARKIKNDIFEASITDKSRELFQ